MINAIVEAVSVALNAEFGDGCEIHMEEMEQGLKEPCFFVFCLNPARIPFLRGRYLGTCRLCVQYFPAGGEKQRECNSVAERLWQCLEFVTVGGDGRLVMGTKMNSEMADGVLNFFVSYSWIARRTEREAPMDGLVSSTDVKGGG